MKFMMLLSAATLLFASPSFVNAQVNYSELVSGDLSANTTSPTDLGTLGLGFNSIAGELNENGTAGAAGSDVFSFDVAAGQELTSVSFLSLAGNGRFFAFSNPNTTIDAGSASGNRYATLIGAGDIGTNILDGTLNDFGGSGGSGNLSSSEYTIYFRENAAGTIAYDLAITTAAVVPEPSTLPFLVVGAALAAIRRRR